MERESQQHLKACHHTHTGMLSLLLLWHGKRIQQHLKACHYIHMGMLGLLLRWRGRDISTASQVPSSQQVTADVG